MTLTAAADVAVAAAEIRFCYFLLEKVAADVVDGGDDGGDRVNGDSAEAAAVVVVVVVVVVAVSNAKSGVDGVGMVW